MSKTKTPELNAARSFSYRNIKKEFRTPSKEESITKQFHLELGEKNEVVIVEDRPCDWQELANKDADKVGLANVLDIARRQGLDVHNIYAFKDVEAIDTSMIDTMNPGSIKEVVASKDESMKKLESTAAQLGVSVADLVNAAISGSLDKFIGDHVASKAENKEGE